MIRNNPAPAACVLMAFAPTRAVAHVKWFSNFDVAAQPRELGTILGADLAYLSGLALTVIIITCAAEITPLGCGMRRALDAVTRWPRLQTALIIRVIGAFFFVSVWATGGMLLTPELKTSSDVVPLIQLAVAAGLIWRKTCILSAIGILLLFALSVNHYGWFHLMDYPIFLGFAAYLALYAFDIQLRGQRPLDIFRYATGITLMWASIEKWAYPEWTFPLFVLHPGMDLGLNPEFFMRAAGAVEFGLAFGLIWTPLVRRFSALVLLGMFVGAIEPFGKVDAIGHAVIIAVLVAIICDDAGKQARGVHLALAPAAYTLLLALTITAYYGLHAVAFGTAPI